MLLPTGASRRRNQPQRPGTTRHYLLPRFAEQKKYPEERMGCVHLGDLKTSMQTDGLRQKARDAFGR